MGKPWYSQNYHVSEECRPMGSAQCDGYDYSMAGPECDCACHEEWDLPITTAGVKAWHDEYHGIENK